VAEQKYLKLEFVTTKFKKKPSHFCSRHICDSKSYLQKLCFWGNGTSQCRLLGVC